MSTNVAPTADRTRMRTAAPYYCGNGHGPNWNHGTCWCGSSYLTPEAGRVTLPLSVALAAFVTAAILIGLAVGTAAAQGLTAPVSYQVGDVLVFGSATRNPSCSVTRNIRNTSDQPLRVIASATWPGQPQHLPPNQGDHGGDAILQPGDQLTAVWTNSHYVTDGALNLTWTVLIPDGTAQIGANHLEAVPACTPETTETSTTTPPVASSAPPQTTSPPSSTTAPVTSTPEDHAPPGVEVTTPTTSPGEAGNVPGTGVLIATQQRQTLAETGAALTTLIVAGLALTFTGVLALTLRRINQERRRYPLADDLTSITRSHEDDAR